MSIVKRQHYVWRHHLRAWASKDRIWAYLLQQQKVISSDLMGVAQQVYFYQLSEINAEDGKFLRLFTDKCLAPPLRPLMYDFIKLSEEYTVIKQKMETDPPAGANADEIEKLTREVEINSLELIHGKIETMGLRLVACRTLADLQALDAADEDGDGFLTAIFFMCVQYFRTRVRKNASLNQFPADWTDRVSRYWNILSFGLAGQLAYGIMQRADRQLCLLHNTSNLEFITGDQPVINILDERTNEQGEADDMELYYPLAPTCALLLRFVPPAEGETETERYAATSVDESAVASYNNDIFKRSEQFVFSSSRAILDDLLAKSATGQSPAGSDPGSGSDGAI